MIVIINYLRDPNAELYLGFVYCIVFACLMSLGAITRNYWVFKGCLTGLQVRKIVIASLYNKVANLSMRSLTETNSGKLITIATGEL